MRRPNTTEDDEALLAVLAAGPFTTTELRDLCGVGYTKTYSRLTALVHKGLVTRFPGHAERMPGFNSILWSATKLGSSTPSP